ncbi:MAG: 5-(carboxyamino)imidazole ribonucleotide synthase [Kofleriaceae bacterium]|mgnify:CR=1 FL=1|nr:5-(carboxyamino)imidazole ribonucleotide synthase [Kofleriaceae bacterium]MBP9205217.1 5-(carboxyamino)imidazole ribonucleotide synthase [Kofleriaceae bacterium]
MSSSAPAPLLPGATIGVLGGGQLGRMLALAARRMGYRIVTLDPSARCPTAQVADGVVVGALDDVEAGLELAAQVDVITLDTEHVPADVLAALEARVPVRPGAAVLRTIQDRLVQKQFLDRLGLPQARWRPIDGEADLDAARAELGDVIVKARRAGYDGKGQVRIDASVDAEAARVALRKLRGQPAVAEEVIRFRREVSVVLARGAGGEIKIYPLAENVHRHHVLHTTRAPAPMAEASAAAVRALGTGVAEALGHVGVLAVELFERADGEFLVNEIAPRTHNSGHFTYGACSTSQFEQHVRAVCGLPLGDPRLLSPAVMVNLIGDLWRGGAPPWQQVLAHPGARLHLYGKDAPAPGRKMGHVLLLDEDPERALADAERVIAALTPA